MRCVGISETLIRAKEEVAQLYIERDKRKQCEDRKGGGGDEEDEDDVEGEGSCDCDWRKDQKGQKIKSVTERRRRMSM
ncbi:hypothetical protein SESBI_32383 [Sesbania bispinosa]|nr:hypothetical protein SESBI_32383 [Sesbania bispinosa]